MNLTCSTRTSFFHIKRHGNPAAVSQKVDGSSFAAEIANIQRKVEMVDSPIEADLIAWLCVQKQFCICSHEESLQQNKFKGFYGLIIPQCPQGPYRLDFLVVIPMHDSTLRLVAVECDGHEFHERSKFQAARDKKRDRYLAANSISVMRFTGSEIYKDPQACACEILRAIMQIHKDGHAHV